MLRAIMEGQYQFASPEWDEVSDEAKDLVRGGEGEAGIECARACCEVWHGAVFQSICHQSALHVLRGGRREGMRMPCVFQCCRFRNC